MRSPRDYVRYEIFIFGVEVYDAHASAALFAVFLRVGAFDVSPLGEEEHRVLIRNEVFFGKLLDSMLHDARSAFISIFLAYFLELLFDDRKNLLRTTQN